MVHSGRLLTVAEYWTGTIWYYSITIPHAAGSIGIPLLEIYYCWLFYYWWRDDLWSGIWGNDCWRLCLVHCWKWYSCGIIVPILCTFILRWRYRCGNDYSHSLRWYICDSFLPRWPDYYSAWFGRPLHCYHDCPLTWLGIPTFVITNVTIRYRFRWFFIHNSLIGGVHCRCCCRPYILGILEQRYRYSVGRAVLHFYVYRWCGDCSTVYLPLFPVELEAIVEPVVVVGGWPTIVCSVRSDWFCSVAVLYITGIIWYRCCHCRYHCCYAVLWLLVTAIRLIHHCYCYWYIYLLFPYITITAEEHGSTIDWPWADGRIRLRLVLRYAGNDPDQHSLCPGDYGGDLTLVRYLTAGIYLFIWRYCPDWYWRAYYVRYYWLLFVIQCRIVVLRYCSLVEVFLIFILLPCVMMYSLQIWIVVVTFWLLLIHWYCWFDDCDSYWRCCLLLNYSILVMILEVMLLLLGYNWRPFGDYISYCDTV